MTGASFMKVLTCNNFGSEDMQQTCSSNLSFRRWVCSSSLSTYSRSSSISSFTCWTVSSSFLMATMSRFTSLTSLWQDSTDFVSSCSWLRISQRATVVSSCRSPRCCSSSSLADRFMLMTLTCLCRLHPSIALTICNPSHYNTTIAYPLTHTTLEDKN